MKKLFLILFCAAFTASAFAVPARPGVRTYEQPDGTKIQVTVHGDEVFHYTTDLQGNTLTRNTEGYWVKAEKQLTTTDIRKARAASPVRHKAAPRRAIQNNLVTKGLVILVNFSDLSFKSENTKDAFVELLNGDDYTYNGATGSVRKYYSDQSSGNFKPTFEVYGPVTLSKGYAYYGGNDDEGYDLRDGQMVAEACKKAYEEYNINLADFDADNDGYVDFVDILFAGYGEADTDNGEDYVWPCEWSLTGSEYGRELKLGDTKIDLFSCHQELDGQTRKRAGIGTACHEFGHVFGLPDFYDTSYSNPTLGDWDVMDGGAYLNKGNTPPGFSGYERMFAEWAEPELLNETADITLPELQSSQKIYVVTSSGQHNLNAIKPNPQTFYILENRQQKGWDKYLPGHGMLIWKIQYNASKWENNTLNNTKVKDQGVAILAADGEVDYEIYEGQVYTYGDSGDSYPGSKKVTSKTIESYNITNIAEAEDNITFHFEKEGTGPVTPGGNGAFKKVTSAPEDWSGTYLIVYETSNTEGLVMDGSLAKMDVALNTEEATISNGTIDTDTKYAFTIEKSGNGYAIKNQSNKYIGWEKEKNGMSETESPFVLTISMEEDGVDVMTSVEAHLRYNKTSGQERFRFFQSSTYTKQQPIQLYKKSSSETDVDLVNCSNIVISSVDRLSVSGLSGNAQIAVYNIAGQMLINTTTDASAIDFDLNNGIYLVRIVDAAETITRKVIVR